MKISRTEILGLMAAGCVLLFAQACAEKKKAPAPPLKTAVPADYVVALPDHNFSAAVWLALGKTSGELHRSELTTLAELDLRGHEIISVSGIEHFPALSRLNLAGNYIRDLAPLSAVTTLTALDLDKNYLIDVTPLKTLVNLRELNLANNEIADAAPLAPLVNMVKLNLANNQISDITPLAGMTRLQWVDVSKNRLTTIAALRKISNAGGLGQGAHVNVEHNSLDSTSLLNHIPVLKGNGAEVRY